MPEEKLRMKVHEASVGHGRVALIQYTKCRLHWIRDEPTVCDAERVEHEQPKVSTAIREAGEALLQQSLGEQLGAYNIQ